MNDKRLAAATSLALVIAVAALVSSVSRPAVAAAGLTAEFADPFVVRDGETYYAFATAAGGNHIQVARSRDLTSWTALPDALPRVPAWAALSASFVWAPSVLARPGGWILYYTARDATSGFQCISRATANRPEGPYVDNLARPLICQIPLCGSIDPSPFVDASGHAWLLWKSDENAAPCRLPSRLWSQALADDGLSLVGAASALLAADPGWEERLIEGPSMIRHGAHEYLFYSASRYESPQYAIGYATCAGPSGPCTKVTRDKPLIESVGAMLGPGGQELFTDISGKMWMAFHAWTAPFSTYAKGGARSLRFARVTFEDGAPVVQP